MCAVPSAKNESPRRSPVSGAVTTARPRKDGTDDRPRQPARPRRSGNRSRRGVRPPNTSVDFQANSRPNVPRSARASPNWLAVCVVPSREPVMAWCEAHGVDFLLGMAQNREIDDRQFARRLPSWQLWADQRRGWLAAAGGCVAGLALATLVARHRRVTPSWNSLTHLGRSGLTRPVSRGGRLDRLRASTPAAHAGSRREAPSRSSCSLPQEEHAVLAADVRQRTSSAETIAKKTKNSIELKSTSELLRSATERL
jgi:hypothetical protein